MLTGPAAASRSTRPAEDGPVGRADAVAALRGVGEAQRLVLQFLRGGKQHASAREHELAERRGPRAVAVTLEERATERALDAFELGGQRRLGHPEPGRRLADAARLRDRSDDLEVPELEVHTGNVKPPQRPRNPHMSGKLTDVVGRVLRVGEEAWESIQRTFRKTT
ncbi:hypothetical protein GCM10020219_046040 [Nonomuraea dietziae]